MKWQVLKKAATPMKFSPRINILSTLAHHSTLLPELQTSWSRSRFKRDNVECDTEAETPVLWPPHAKSWLIGKDPDAGRDWGQEEKATTEDEMAGWHHRLDGRRFG